MNNHSTYAKKDSHMLALAKQRGGDISDQPKAKTQNTKHVTSSGELTNTGTPREMFTAVQGSHQSTITDQRKIIGCYEESSFLDTPMKSSYHLDHVDEADSYQKQKVAANAAKSQLKKNCRETNSKHDQKKSTQNEKISMSSSEHSASLNAVEGVSQAKVKTEKHQPCSSNLKKMLKRKLDAADKSTASQKSSGKHSAGKSEAAAAVKSESSTASGLHSEHLLYDILSKKKMALMKSPEVMKFFQQRQRAKVAEMKRYQNSSTTTDR